jgi:formylglycine-generating enzyme required for sulfatase activity
MHGNLWEWCSDWHAEYPNGVASDPQGPSRGSFRVLRGGGWFNTAGYCRSAIRLANEASMRSDYLGVRLAMSPSGVEPPEAGAAK